MGRDLRNTDPNRVHIITCRTACAELMLIPDAELTETVGGIIAKYQNVYDITIYDGIILGNHYHFLVQAAEGALPSFAENVNREIAKRVNRLLLRQGCFWGRRYDDLITIEETDALEGLLYISTNAVKHGLVTHPRHWPGFKLYHQLRGAKPKEYRFINYTEYHRAKRIAANHGKYVHRSDYETIYTLEITPIPIFAGLSAEERHLKLDKLTEERTAKLVRERREAGKSFLGRKNILAQKRQGTFPNEVSKSPRPPCYTKNREARNEYREYKDQVRAQYSEASKKFRSGYYNAVSLFPPFCLLPPLHHIPKDRHTEHQ